MLKSFYVASNINGQYSFEQDSQKNLTIVELNLKELPDIEDLLRNKSEFKTVSKYSHLFGEEIIVNEKGFEFTDGKFYVPVPGIKRGPEPMGKNTGQVSIGY